MAAHTYILLLAALCIGSAFSLRCYTCYLESSNSNCMSATTNCSSTETYCKTSVGTATVGGVSATSINKFCTDTCSPGSFSFDLMSSSISCCTTDLCNLSSAISIKSGYAAIFLVMGIILMFFSDSLL